MKTVKITVLRKTMHEDIAREYLTEGVRPVSFLLEAVEG